MDLQSFYWRRNISVFPTEHQGMLLTFYECWTWRHLKRVVFWQFYFSSCEGWQQLWVDYNSSVHFMHLLQVWHSYDTVFSGIFGIFLFLVVTSWCGWLQSDYLPGIKLEQARELEILQSGLCRGKQWFLSFIPGVGPLLWLCQLLWSCCRRS